ncbi:hypothetical protein LCGC14_2367650 [marine sediment metagenome]|uniref:LysM domain-containing protein n=1 Tax=marine sediment metagenome TaxID=412755 RepID=A0A0F9EH54_9ZZZZ
MSNVKSFDISAWQGRPPADWFKALAADGHKLGVIQLWGSGPDDEGRNRGNGPNPDAQYQLGQTRDAGMALSGYNVIPPDSTVRTDQLIRAGLGAAGPFARDLKFDAADVESNQLIHPASPGQRLSNALADIRRASLLAIIYTSRSKWPKSMGTNSTAFSRVPLWDASYLADSGVFNGWTTVGDIDRHFVKYGGWDERAMWQLAGTVDAVPNFPNKADLNLADFTRLGITETLPEEVDMPDSRVDDVLVRLGKLEARAHDPHAGPAPAPKPKPKPRTRYDKLTAADGHATGFAQRHGLSLGQLQELNPNGPRSRPNKRTWDGHWGLVYPGDQFRVA